MATSAPCGLHSVILPLTLPASSMVHSSWDRLRAQKGGREQGRSGKEREKEEARGGVRREGAQEGGREEKKNCLFSWFQELCGVLSQTNKTGREQNDLAAHE